MNNEQREMENGQWAGAKVSFADDGPFVIVHCPLFVVHSWRIVSSG